MKTTFIKWVLVLAMLMSAFPLTGALMAQEDSTEAIPAFLGIGYAEAKDGARITEIVPESAAEEAALQIDDVITAIDGEVITYETIAAVISTYNAGDSLTLTVLRDGESEDITLILGERPAEVEESRRGPRGRGNRNFPPISETGVEERPYLGVTVQDGDNGVVINAVDADSPAEEAGLQADDVIVSINGEAVENSQHAVALVRALSAGDEVTLSVERDGETVEVRATLASREFPVRAYDFSANIDLLIYDAAAEQWIVRSTGGLLAETDLETGDVITAINGEVLDNAGLDALLAELDEDTLLSLSVERDGEALTLEVPAQAFNGILSVSRGGLSLSPFTGQSNKGRLGVVFASLNEDTAAEHAVDVTEGALILEVQEDSPAAEAGLEVGDIILTVEGDIVDLRRDLADRIYAFEAGDVIVLEVLRGEETLTLEVTLGQTQNSPMGRHRFFEGGALLDEGFIERLIPFGFDPDRIPNMPRIPQTPPRPRGEAPNL